MGRRQIRITRAEKLPRCLTFTDEQGLLRGVFPNECLQTFFLCVVLSTSSCERFPIQLCPFVDLIEDSNISCLGGHSAEKNHTFSFSEIGPPLCCTFCCPFGCPRFKDYRVLKSRFREHHEPSLLGTDRNRTLTQVCSKQMENRSIS